MSVLRAKRLLGEASREPRRLERHLLVAAAITAAFDDATLVIVGGTAQEYWTRADYHETDLDLVGSVDAARSRVLRDLGFSREGRHWFHEGCGVAVEFPDDTLDGQYEKTTTFEISRAPVTVIGLEDLYLDRVRQATMSWPRKDINFHAALAVAAADLAAASGRYTAGRLREIARAEPQTGAEMKQIDSFIRRTIRRQLSAPND